MRAVLLAASLVAGCASVPESIDPPIFTSDVDRFYALYDAAGGHPTATSLQHDYLDAGTEGLHRFAVLRQFTGDAIAAAVETNPVPFARARRCAAALPAVRLRIRDALVRLAALDPQATFPPVTIAVGRGKTGGTTSRTDVLIGLEVLCSADFFGPDVEGRFVHVIAHEYAHVQQPAAEETDLTGATVLFASLIEGGAEFIAELTSCSVGYRHLDRLTRGREDEIERRFATDVDRTDLSAWLYNGIGDEHRPGDLGYWVGYRIVKSYYARAADKPQALQDILHISRTNAKDFLAKSGWVPGMTFD